MQNNYSNQELTYAGFWVRLAAYCLDSILVFLVLLVVRLFLSGIMSLLSGTPLGGNLIFQYDLKDIVLYVFQVLYFILCTWLTGTTLGKKAMNLRVVSAENGGELKLLDVVYRETIGRFLCSLSVGIGYMVAGWDGQKRGFHDMLCDTRVIYAKRIKVYPVYQAPQMTRKTLILHHLLPMDLKFPGRPPAHFSARIFPRFCFLGGTHYRHYKLCLPPSRYQDPCFPHHGPLHP